MILRVSPLTPMNDQGRISPHIIKQTSDEVTEIYKLGDYYLIKYQNLQTNINYKKLYSRQ